MSSLKTPCLEITGSVVPEAFEGGGEHVYEAVATDARVEPAPSLVPASERARFDEVCALLGESGDCVARAQLLASTWPPSTRMLSSVRR